MIEEEVIYEENKQIDNDNEKENIILKDTDNIIDNINHSNIFNEIQPFKKDKVVTNVSAAVMLKIPAHRLTSLREDYEKEKEGLNLINFLKAFIKNMDLNSQDELIAIVPDLVDFFTMVDVNGDGTMEWSEFVMFVCEQVAPGKGFYIRESMQNVFHQIIQPPSCRTPVRCSKYIPEFGRLFVGTNNEIQLYDLNYESSDWLTAPFVAIHLHEIGYEDEKKKKIRKIPIKQCMDAEDFAFIASKDILLVLRTDLSIDMFRFMSRTKFLPETICLIGNYKLSNSYAKIQIRDQFHNDSILLFAIGTNSNKIDKWEINCGVYGHSCELINHTTLDRHTDSLRDILVIQNDMYKLLVSCGMDKKVIIWDLITCRYKTTRTGFSAGVQCLAYDGRSLLLAGGFDHKIVVFDLDAEIDKPLFSLWGHSSPITRIVSLGFRNRTFSLDSSGELRYWDSDKNNPYDKEERQIDSTNVLQDHLYQFDVFTDVDTNHFETHLGIILVAQGRRQHIFKLVDHIPKISPPLDVLYSTDLQMVITVHQKDILFWNAITGEKQYTMENVGGNSFECTVSTLDDKLKKLIVGSSNGVISVYNCLTGVKMKSYDPMSSTVCFLIYSPDKTIIALSGNGDLCIYDELNNNANQKLNFLRGIRISDVDVVAMAYSHKLGLIATADCTGRIVVLVYEFLTIESILEDVTGTDIGKIEFLDPFPLLLVTDTIGNFTIIAVGEFINNVIGRKIWRSEAFISKPVVKESRRKSMLETSTNGNNNADDSLLDDADDDDIVPKTFTRIQKMEYLTKRRDVKSIFVHIEADSSYFSLEEENVVDIALKEFSLLEKSKKAKNVEESDSENDDENTDLPILGIIDYSNEKLPIFPDKFFVHIMCGNSDGTVCIKDLTPTLRDINIGILPKNFDARSRPNYNPRRQSGLKTISIRDFERSIWSEDDVLAGENYSTCELLTVWNCGLGAIPSIRVVGSGNNKTILTSSEDSSVTIWTMDGFEKGALTKGQKWDKLFKPRWITPFDMEAREKYRNNQAMKLVNRLGLQINDKRDDNRNKSITISSNSTNNILTDDASATFSQKTSSSNKLINGDTSVNSGRSPEKSTKLFNSTLGSSHNPNPNQPDRVRVIGQLGGEITYEQSHRDISNKIMDEKRKTFRLDLLNFGKTEKKKEKKFQNPFDSVHKKKWIIKDKNALEDPFANLNYINEVLYDGKTIDIINEEIAEKEAHDENSRRKIQSKYDSEIAQIDADDKNNWDITSSNRLRSFYNRLYLELDKAGISSDKMDIFVIKLNKLSPNNDFSALVDTLRTQGRESAMHLISCDISIGTEHVQNYNDSCKDKQVEIILPISHKKNNFTELKEDGPKTIIPQLFYPIKISNPLDLLASPIKNSNATFQLDSEMNRPSTSQGIARKLEEKIFSKTTNSTINHMMTKQNSTPLPMLRPSSGRKSSRSPPRLRPSTSHGASSKDHLESPAPRNSLRPLTAGNMLSNATLNRINGRSQYSKNKDLFKLHNKPQIFSLAEEELMRQNEQKSNLKCAADFEIKLNTFESDYNSSRKNIKRAVRQFRKQSIANTTDHEQLDKPVIINPNVFRKNSTINNKLRRSSTVQDIVVISAAFKRTQSNVARKIKMCIESKFSNPVVQHSDRERKQRTSTLIDNYHAKKIFTEEEKNEKLLQRTEFGNYKARELMLFFHAWDSLPKKVVRQIMSDQQLYQGGVTNGNEVNNIGIDIADLIKKDSEKEIFIDPNFDSRDLISLPGNYIKMEEEEEEEEEEDEDEEEEVVVEVEEECPFNYINVIVVPLKQLISHKYFKSRPYLRAELEKAMKKLCHDGTHSSAVEINLADALQEMCPDLSHRQRKDILQYFEIKSQRKNDSNPSAIGDKTLSKEDFDNMLLMFNYFDADKSGSVSKREIQMAVAKYQNPMRKSSKIISDADKVFGSGNDETVLNNPIIGDYYIDKMMEEADENYNEEIDFTEFVNLFKDLLL